MKIMTNLKRIQSGPSVINIFVHMVAHTKPSSVKWLYAVTPDCQIMREFSHGQMLYTPETLCVISGRGWARVLKDS